MGFIGFLAAPTGVQRRIVRLNGEPTLLAFAAGRLISTTSFATDGERIVAVYNVLNPDKLRRVAAELGLGVLDAEALATARGRT